MRKRVINLLDSLNVKYRLIDHPAVFTISDVANLPEDVKPIKNLLIQESGNGRKFLVVMDGNARLDTKLIKERFNTKKLSFSSNDALTDIFGVSSGAVSIFGFINNKLANVKVVIDESIVNSGNGLGFHPNDNTATVLFEPNELESILKGMSCDYVIMKLY
ncbi:MAG: YbaK/EbsC family protein [Bacteroidales bacterium]|nr:YbaK/EbsC family protein [Bacteroidales bacterium]